MSQFVPVFTAFIAAFAALCGIFVNNWFQLGFRKEKFKELIYKQKLAVYADIISHATAVVDVFPDLGAGHILNEEKFLAKKEEFLRQRDALRLALSRAEYLASENVLKSGIELQLELVLPPDIRPKRLEYFTKIVKAQFAMKNAVRIDLGIDPISDSIRQTIYDSATRDPMG